MTRKLRSPYFVTATVLKNGDVELIDDDGERYRVQMHRDFEWPFLYSTTRHREMRRDIEEMRRARESDLEGPRPPGPFRPKLVG
jgi:hypothetical protein